MKKALLVLMLSTSLVFSQGSISGSVSDENNNPIPGATITIAGTSTGVVTDFDGNYSIDASAGDVLSFSSLGFTSKNVTVGGQSQINVSLVADIQNLDEVVVTGYGTQSKRNITGSVSSIDSDLIENRGLTSLGTALSGTTPGVFVSQNSGQPGQDEIAITVRGVGTINNSDPLIIIDGVEGDLNALNPNDVESITVLKDAASSSIYGSRAANGVVVVKTKRGFKGQPTTLTYDASYAISERTLFPDVNFSALDNANFLNQAAANFGAAPRFSASELSYISGMQDSWIQNPFDLAFESAPIVQHNLAASGGSESTNYRISLGILDQDAITVGPGEYQRINLSANVDTQVSESISMGTSINITRGETNSFQGSLGANLAGAGGGQNLAKTSMNLHNIFAPLYDLNGNYAMAKGELVKHQVGPGSGRNNLLAPLENYVFNGSKDAILANAYIQWEPIDNLVIKGVAAINTFHEQTRYFQKKIKNYYNDGTFYEMFPKRQSNKGHLEFNTETFYLTADWSKDLGNDTSLNILAGYSQEESSSELSGAMREGHLSDGVQVLDAGSTDGMTNYGSLTDFSVQSVFARMDLNIMDKYLIQANVRADGSSRFKNDKWGTFPSFSAGWILSEEDFLEDSAINFLKVRASWGELGNANIGNYEFAKKLSLSSAYNFGGNLAPGVAQTTLGNPDLSWETSTTTNFGIDLLLESGIGLNLDIFETITEDILYNLPVNSLTGFTTQLTNAATIEKDGFELGVSYTKSFGDLNVSIQGQMSKAENIVTELNPGLTGVDDRVINYNNTTRILGEGLPLDAFWGLQNEGIFRTAADFNGAADHSGLGGGSQLGDLKFRDNNGDGVINADDAANVGTDYPTVTYGFNIFMDYKNWDMNMIWQGIADAQYYGWGEIWWPYFADMVYHNMWEDSWTPSNPDASMPRTWIGESPSNMYLHDFFIYERDYLRLKNLSIGYTFDEGAVPYVDSLRVYFQGTNLLTFTDFPQVVDPESRTGRDSSKLVGSDYQAGADRVTLDYGQLKTMSLGINVKF